MSKNKSLKKQILLILIYFSVFIGVFIGVIFCINFYYSKLSIIEHNQKQILYQVESEVNKFLVNINQLSSYIKLNYTPNNSLLKNIVDTNTNISSILILNKDGTIEDFYAPTNLNIYKGFDYSKKEYFYNIKKNKNYYWSSVFLSTIDETSSFSFSFKLGDKVAVLMIKLKELTEFVSRFKNQDGTHMVRIIDSNGVIILNEDNPNSVLQRNNLKNTEVYKKLINIVKPYSFSKFKALSNGELQYGTYTKIEKTSWKIVIRENYNLILKSLITIIYGTLFTIIVFILIAVFISLKISRQVFKSFDELKETTTKISNGDYNFENKKSYYDEFNQLLKSFNKMKIEIDKREDALEESLESFKKLVNLTMEAIIIHKDGICVDVNDVALRLFAYDKKEEMIGKSFLSFVANNSKRLVESNLEKDSEPYEIEFLRKDNTSFMSVGQGRFLNLFGSRLKISTIIDITDIKEKEKLLFQQSKMASMGEMIGNIAHQWRQPLSAISSAASGMKLQKEYGFLKEEDFISGIDAIVNSTQYLSKTIDDFRNFFKTDKLLKSFSVRKVIENILSLLSASFKNNEIEVITNLDDDSTIMGYENELTQAIINILNNAKDALILTNNEKRLIFITLKKVEDNIFQISIKDNGGGIKEEAISSIFEPYFTTKYNQQGTGIGLYMTHQIIVLHMKGKIRAQNCSFDFNNKSYKGAQFLIDLQINQNNT